MSSNDQNNIIDTIHQMELRLVERMTRVETEIRGWRKESEQLRKDIDRQGREIYDLQTRTDDKFTKITLAVVALGLIGLGNLAVRVVPIFAL